MQAEEMHTVHLGTDSILPQPVLSVRLCLKRETILDLKRRISDLSVRPQIRPDQFRLLVERGHRRVQPAENMNLCDAGVTDGATVHMVLRLC